MHLANHGGRNIGNAALIYGVERVLREDLGRELEFVPEPWDLYSRGLRRFDGAFVDAVNACDGLIVGGAVSFDGSTRYANTGFRFDLPLELWPRLRKPVVFYGLSHRMFPRSSYAHVDALRRAVETAFDAGSMLFAVRNDGTKEWLEASVLGSKRDELHVVPDPGLFVPVEEATHPELSRERTNVVLALNAEDEPLRWAVASHRRGLGRPPGATGLRSLVPISSNWGWREARAGFLDRLRRALDRLAGATPIHLVFCSHDFVDVGMGLELWRMLAPALQYETSFTSTLLLPSAGPRFYDLYTKADLALSMRIHSMSPAIGLGTPVVPIVTQSRIELFLEDAGLSDLGVNGHASTVEDEIYERARAILSDPEPVRARLADARARLRERVASFNARVAGLLEAT
jgi:hypothetical protein